MNAILICICVLSFLTLIVIFYLIKNYKNKNINSIDNRVGKVINVLAFISTGSTVLALIISILGLIMQNKSPKLEIEVYTMHGLTWEEENGDKQLCLSLDNDGHVDFDLGIPNIWYLHIKNEGNQYAENVKIKIKFEDLGFVTNPDSFILSDYIYGTGFFSSIEHTYDQVIQPGEIIKVPYIPFTNAKVYDIDSYYEPAYTNMNIKIYENNSLALEKNFLIEFVENSLKQDLCFLENPYISDEDKIVREFNEYYFDDEDYFSEYDLSLYSMLYPKEFVFSLEECEIVYQHYLRLIDVYNSYMSSIYRKLAVFYGRLYYLELSKEIDGINIEQAIQNDINIQK